MATLFNEIKHKVYVGGLKLLIRFAPVAATPMSFVGPGSTAKLCQHISRMGVGKVLIVTDKPLCELGIVTVASDAFTEQDVEIVIYDGVLPDPTLDIAAAGLRVLEQERCDGVLAIGGGSAIDAAKTIAAAATNGGDVKKMVGFFKAKLSPLPLFAIPTTSGTGSEVTFGAVISDSQSHEKYMVGDPKIVPKAVALDPELIAGLPPAITAATGMDALTHAVEAYVSTWANNQSDAYAKMAVKMIFENLPIAYANGADLQAREQMSLAAYYAGLAINGAAVGNIHAIAHQFGARYGTPHGLANALVMPEVLRFSKGAIDERLAELADLISLGKNSDTSDSKADKIISAIAELNEKFGIGNKLEALQEKDIAAIGEKAVKEGASYPVPRLMDQGECEAMIRALCN
jgi:alcohol dehydrogenase class IV